MYVFLVCTAIGKCLYHSPDQAHNQEVGMEWALISINLFKAKMKVMLLVSEWTTKEVMRLGSQRTFLWERLLICISLISSVFGKEDENEQRR